MQNEYTGVLNNTKLQTNFGALTQQNSAILNYHITRNRLDVSPHCWQSQSAKTKGNQGTLCIQAPLYFDSDQGDVNLRIHNFDTAILTPFLPHDLTWQAKLHGDVLAKWQKGVAPDIKAVLYSNDGLLGMHTHGGQLTHLSYDKISLIAKSEASGLRMRTDIDVQNAGGGYVDVLIDPYQNPRPIKGALVLNSVNLAALHPFLPALQTLKGDLDVAGGIGGTLKNPLFFGEASVKDAAFALVDMPLSLNQINLQASITGTEASIDGQFSSGDGKGDITAHAHWQDVPQINANIKGQDLSLIEPPMLTANISPDLNIILRPTQKHVNIEGVVLIPHAIIRPPEANDDVVVISPDVTVLDRRLSHNVARVLAPVRPWSIDAKIGIDFDDVHFRGFGANLPLSGALSLQQKGQGSLNAKGMVVVSERRQIDVIGQNLELNYAQMRFDGSLNNPKLSMEGVRQIDGKTLGVRITGTAANPIIKTFNDAGLSEQATMNALATGSLENSVQVSEEDFKGRVNNTLAAAGLSLGLQSAQGVTDQLGQLLGFDRLVLDAKGGANDTHLNVTGYISPDLYIRYGVGVFNADSSLSMRYQLTKRVYIEATSAADKFIDVVYRFEF